MTTRERLGDVTRFLGEAADTRAHSLELSKGRDAAIEALAEALRRRRDTQRARRWLRLPLLATGAVALVAAGWLVASYAYPTGPLADSGVARGSPLLATSDSSSTIGSARARAPSGPTRPGRVESGH